MRTLSDYLSLPYRLELIEDYEEGGFAAAYPELPRWINYGGTIESAVGLLSFSLEKLNGFFVCCAAYMSCPFWIL